MLGFTTTMTLVFALFLCTSAFGATTEPEADLSEIFSEIYGGTFTGDASELSNGTVTASLLSSADDQLFSGDFSARALAHFASYDQSFGLLAGDSGGTVTPLFDVEGDGFDVTGEAEVIGAPETYRFARSGSEGNVFSSQDSDNVDASDHMLTYHLVGGDLDLYVLFFEDLAGEASDFDYQDLVVEVVKSASVPSPGALGSGLALLTLLVARTTARRRRMLRRLN